MSTSYYTTQCTLQWNVLKHFKISSNEGLSGITFWTQILSGIKTSALNEIALPCLPLLINKQSVRMAQLC